MEDRNAKDLGRLETKLEHVDKSLADLLAEVKSMKSSFVEKRENEILFRVRLEKLEEELVEIQEEQAAIKTSLEGNITARVLKHWILGAAGVMTAVITLFGMMLRLIK